MSRIVLASPIVGEQSTRVSINVGPRVLGLSGLKENLRGNFINLSDHFE